MDNQEINQELNEGLESGKTYTAEEVQKLLQSESDRRVNDALKKRDKDYQTKIKEAEKLARMNEQEKADYERSKLSEQLTAKEQELNLKENKITGLEIFAEKNLPASLIEFVLDADAEAMHSKIKKLDDSFKKAVAEEVKKKLSSTTPKVATVTSDGITKEQFQKMTVMQKNDFYKKNPELFRELSK